MEQFTSELRLGDVIDDHCIKCRRVTNHSIVSIVDSKAAKVRCRTCYHDHDYRNEQAPPTKKELLQQALFKEVLSGVAPSADALAAGDPDAIAAALAEDIPGEGLDEEETLIERETLIGEETVSEEEVSVVEEKPVAKAVRAAPKKKPAKARSKRA